MTRSIGIVGATIEARMTSARLPGKVLMPVLGRPMLELMIERVRRAKLLDCVVVATTTNRADDPVVELADRLGVGSFRGSEDDVLGRVLGAARAHNIETIVELTGDCPLIDPALIDECIEVYRSNPVDYISNRLERTYPVGMETQVFSTAVLADVARRTDDPADREHVSYFIYNNAEGLYSVQNVAGPPELSDRQLHITLDTEDDLVLIRRLFEALYPGDSEFDLAAILKYVNTNAQLRTINQHVPRKWE